MGKILVIAEKPSVASDIAKVLGCKTKGEGCFLSDEYIISWAIGHLITLADPEDYDPNLKKWRMDTLPMIPGQMKLKPINNTKKQLNILKKLMNSSEVSSIICATDSGREGELIFRYVYDYVKCTKPFDRLWISSMTDAAIKEGFRTLKSGKEYDNLFYSARCRSEADWLVGMNATRAYTLKYNVLLSIGRVQTPTLAILVARQKEIDSFVPKDYWQLKGSFGSYFGMWFNPENNENKLFEKEEADRIYNKVLGKEGYIKSIKNEKKTQLPGLLYDLTLLQRECNRRYGYSAQKTLNIAQDLYEKKKMITYPRTDSQYLSEDMIPKIYSTMGKLNAEPYSTYVDYLKSLEKLPITKRIVDSKKVTDHHAIIPTDQRINLSRLNKDEFNVFDMIARKFIAAFYPNYIYNVTKIVTSVEEESFLTQGNTIVQLGWKELYKDDKPEKKEEDAQVLPNVSEGDKFTAEEVEILAKQTKPPKPYNEEHLLSAMENAGRFVDDETLKEQLKESGIGTPATRAAIIERIIQVGYIQRKGKNLIPTEKGMKLIEILPQELISPETTGKWEKGLNSIAKGKMESERFMGSINRYVHYIIGSARNASVNVTFPEEEKKRRFKASKLGKCPLCGEGDMLENSKSFYCSRWRNGCKMTVWKNATSQYGLNLDEKIMKQLLVNKKVAPVNIVLPQTQENCTAELILDMDKEPKVQIINVTRVSAQEEQKS